MPEEFSDVFNRLNQSDRELYAWAEQYFLEKTSGFPTPPVASKQHSQVRDALRDMCSDVWDSNLSVQRRKAAEKRQKHGDWWTIYQFEARTLARQGKIEEAEATLLEGERKFPGLLLFDIFELYLQHEQGEKAKHCLDLIEKNTPKPPFEVNSILNQHYCRFITSTFLWEKRFLHQETALGNLTTSMRPLAWVTRDLLRLYSHALLDSGRPDEAMRFLRSTARDADPKSQASVRLLMAEACFGGDTPDRVADSCLQAVELDPLAPDVVVKAATLLANCDRREQAVAVLEAAAARLRNAWIGKPVVVALARHLLDQGEAGRAVAVLEQVSFDPEADFSQGKSELELDICTLLLRAGAEGVARKRHLLRLQQVNDLQQLDIVLCRKLGLHRHAIDRLQEKVKVETTQDALRLYAKELAVTLFEDGRQDEADHVLTRFFPASRLPQGEALFKAGETLCVVRAAPWVFCNYVCNALLPVPKQALHLVTTQPYFAQRLGFASVAALPEGKFDYVRDKEAVVSRLGRESFDACLVLGSTANCLHYVELTKLAGDIARRVFFYAFDQLLGVAPQERFVELSTGGRKEIRGDTVMPARN